MRSLYSGVSGLQAHQTAIDVEGNNIANVNTTGYKYSRVNFADQMYQTLRTATGPEDGLGGKDAKQIGLGVTVDATTKVFTTGSIEQTQAPLDMAIEGDGFFVVSGDNGRTYNYTRNGQFSRDKLGNLVTTGGYKVQGWMRDEDTKTVDTSSPIQNITIPSDLTTEAMATDTVTIKANLNSGTSIGEKKQAISSLDKFHRAYDENGNGVVIADDTTTPVTYEVDEQHNENSRVVHKFDSNQNLIEFAYDMGAVFDSKGEGIGLRAGQGIWTSYRDSTRVTGQLPAGEQQVNFNINGTLINGTIGRNNATATGGLPATTSQENAEQFIRLVNMQSSKTGVVASLNDDNTITFTNDNRTGLTSATKNIRFSAAPDGAGGTSFLVAGLQTVSATNPTALASDGTSDAITAYKYQYVQSGSNVASANGITAAQDDLSRTFTTTEDLRAWLQADARLQGVGGVAAHSTGSITGDTTTDVTVNSSGQFKISRSAGADDAPILNIAVTGFGNTLTGNSGISENSSFTSIMKALEGQMSANGTFRTSQNLFVSSVSSQSEIFDSLGSKHTLSIRYTKVGTTPDYGTEWMIQISVPQPGVINNSGSGLSNVVMGYLKFDDKGGLLTYTPATISFTPNNGARANQNITFDVGTPGNLDGITSFTAPSSVDQNLPNGYTGGNLQSLLTDTNGNIIGTFTNNQSFVLARVATAKFANNEGLLANGGNLFTKTGNSGEPIIGAPNTGGRGKIMPTSLEMSNVDLSRSLTKLIVIQRGYQANSKTITTSDQLLNTLLQLKQ